MLEGWETGINQTGQLRLTRSNDFSQTGGDETYLDRPKQDVQGEFRVVETPYYALGLR